MVKCEMSLDLVKCGMCGKATVISEGHRHVCEECRDPEHKLYARVRMILGEYPDSGFTVQNIAEMVKAEESQIRHLVDSGFFKLTVRGLQFCEEREGNVF